MEDRKKRLIIICGLIILVLITAVAYSALASKLEVSGTTTVNTVGTWNIYFSNLSAPTIKGDVELTRAVLSTTMFDLKASLTKPGDSVSFTFDVVNGGILDAKLTSINFIGEELLEENNLSYQLVYVDQNGNETPLKENEDKLFNKNKDGNKKTLKLTVSYDINATETEWDTKEMQMGVIMIYTQDNSSTN